MPPVPTAESPQPPAPPATVPTVPLTDRRAAVAAARAALTGLAAVLWQAQGADLGRVFREVDDLIRLGEAARVAVLAEAVDRGDASTGAVSMGSAGVGWVCEYAPTLAVGGGAARQFRVVTDTLTADTKPLRAAWSTVGWGCRTRWCV